MDNTTLEYIRQHYPHGNVKEIAEHLGFTVLKLRGICSRYNIPRLASKKGLNRKISQTDDELLYMYLDRNMSTTEIGKEVGCSGARVAQLLRPYGLMRDPEVSHKKYKLDLAFFDKIDTAEKAWVLGWIYTDGSIWGERAMSISLHHEDVWVVEKIRQLLGTDTPIQNIPARDAPQVKDPTKTMHIEEQRRLVVYSKPMYRQLVKLGLTQNKSLTVKYPEFIPDHLFGHFLRGAIEGDGSIHTNDDNPYFSKIRLTGTLEFVTRIAERIDDFIGCKKYYIEQPSEANTHTLSFTARSGYGQQLFDLIYKDSDNLRLARKYEKAITWLSHAKIITTQVEKDIFDSFDDEEEAMIFIENRRKQRSHASN